MKKSDIKDYNRLLKEENEVVNETLEHVLAALFEQEKDLNDLQADMAHEYTKSVDLHEADMACADMTLREFEGEIGRLTGERGRFRGIIRELKKEKYNIGIELEKLKKQNARLTEELDAADRTIRSLEEKIRKLEDKR